MFGSFLVTLREGIEAALIIGIILAYLNRTGHRRGFRPVWLGTTAAIVVSLIAGATVYLLAGELKDPADTIFEGSVLLLAVGVLTWMIFWMRRQARNIKAELQAQVDSAVTSGSAFGLALIAFVAVVREGIETVLFLLAAQRVAESAVLFITGGLVGLAVAAAIGYAIYKGTSRFNLRTFFNVTGLLLIVFAAGLLAQGIHEFNELGIVPAIVEPLWDTNALVAAESAPGHFLTALFGYNAEPSLTETIAYLAFLVLTIATYFGWGKAHQKGAQ